MCHTQAVFTPRKSHSVKPKHSRIRFRAHATNMADARKNANPGCFRGLSETLWTWKNHPTRALKRFRALEVLGYFEKHTPLFRNSRYKPNLESTCGNGFSPDLGGKMAAFWVCKCNWVMWCYHDTFPELTWPFPLAQAQVVPLKPLRGVDSLTSGLFLCPVNKIQFMIILWSRIYIEFTFVGR